MAQSQTEEIPAEEDMVNDMEAIENRISTEEWGKDQEKLRELITRLEKAYDRREKVIARIMRYSTGFESEKALRMYDIPTLERWARSLENFRAEKLKK